MALWFAASAARAAPPAPASTATLLARAGKYAGNDDARFQATLHALEQRSPLLNQVQRQRVQYWEAWDTQNRGDYNRAIRMFRQVSEHADDPLLAVRARNQLVRLYMINRKYVKAFTLANALIRNLDRIPDWRERNRVLLQAIEILTWQKQYDQAMKFARQMQAVATTGKERCKADYAATNTLLQRGGALTSSSPRLQQTVDTCLRAGLLGFANTMRLNWAGLMNDEGHPARALAFLDRIEPDIRKTAFHAHIASLYVTRAQAYLTQGNDAQAMRWARATLDAGTPGSFTWTRQAAYKVLYQSQEHMGHYRAALASHEHYMDQYRASTDDARAQALAYQIVTQDVLSKRLKLKELGKRNRILLLQKRLEEKSDEASHLYLLLLLLVLASIAFWAWRIKHSQIRFRDMARHDDLTGSFNRQYFFEQAERILQRLHKSGGHACLMILDMDHFKRINDAYGHNSGDEVLKHAARICREHLRDSDVFGRLGGEEFAILMPGCGTAQGARIGERIRQALAHAPVRIPGAESVTVTTSIGLAGTQVHGHALKPLLMAADNALYEAKRGGRNRLVMRAADPAPMPT